MNTFNKLKNKINPTVLEALNTGQLSFQALSKDDKIVLREAMVGALMEKAKNDFMTYVELMAPEILPEGFVSGKHIAVLAKKLQEIEKTVVETEAFNKANQNAIREKKVKAKKSKRAQYFLPPGGMKSKLISILFVSWFMGRHPQWPVLQLGHSTKFCIDNFGRQVLEVLFSDKHIAIFPDDNCRVKRTARSAQSFQLVGGGKYYTTGAGSKIAGRRAALLISDDVISEQEAYSDSVRNKINEWYIPGARSRMLPFGTEIIVNTRWHLEDLSGFLEKRDSGSENPWEIIRFPAILDRESAKLLGLQEGESFWPELWPLDIFIEAQRTMSASKFNAMYMQNPIADDGNIIKETYWQEWDEEDEPLCEAVIVSLDTAFSEKQSADYSGYTVWGVFFQREIGRNGFEYIAANLILLGSEKGRWSFPVLLEKILGRYEKIQGKWDLVEEGVLQKWQPDYYIVEKKASGQSLIQELRLKQMPVVEFDPGRDDKITRMNACVPTFMSGRVWYPMDKAWAKSVVAEVCQFPNGPSKDIPDTVSQAIIWLRKGLVVPSEGEVGWEDMEDAPTVRRKASTYWGAVAGE